MVARIVILNGVGSSGKTSIAKALQTLTRDPYLHVQMDAFLEMLPEAYLDHDDGLRFVTTHDHEKPVIVIENGPVARRAFRGMRHAVAAMASQGNNLIIDDVMLGDERAEYDRILAAYEVFHVGLFVPLDVLEARESHRGDRLIGLARWQYERVHQGKVHDLELDTTSGAPLDCAAVIKARFDL
jgi:chloramphenicol 3-O phosphotransferase